MITEPHFYLEAPKRLERYPLDIMAETIFLAGSITGAVDWQKEATNWLLPHFNIFNPRRSNFDVSNPTMEREQITWEHAHLKYADIALFYFSNETLAPISLFEYGKQLALSQYASFRKTYVCINPHYKRKNDVLIQTELENIDISKNIFFDLAEMCQYIIKTKEPSWRGNNA